MVRIHLQIAWLSERGDPQLPEWYKNERYDLDGSRGNCLWERLPEIGEPRAEIKFYQKRK